MTRLGELGLPVCTWILRSEPEYGCQAESIGGDTFDSLAKRKYTLSKEKKGV
jgi:hypothetical protein